MSTRRVVAEWLRDSAIGFLLIVGGLALAGLIHWFSGSEVRLLRPFGVCLGLVPFLWFAKRKRVISFDLMDAVAWFAFAVLSDCALSHPPVAAWLHDHEYCGACLFPAIVLGSIYVYSTIRKFGTSRRAN